MSEPLPRPSFREADFRKICENGFGDGYNAYAFSMAEFRDRIFVGTSRANLALLKFGMPFVTMDVWPVECPFDNYSTEFENGPARGEIWSYAPGSRRWQRVHQAPFVQSAEGVFSRELGFRAMSVFKGRSDSQPALYVATWSRSRDTGPNILRSEDGETFDPTPKPRFGTQGLDLTFNAIRNLVPFKGRLYTAPVGATKGNVNLAGISLLYECDDPAGGEWRCVNEPGFGTLPDVATIYEIAVFGDHLYAGTAGLNGFQIWRSRCEGTPPYSWECVLRGGAGRGALNQGPASMVAFKGALYIGTGIQNGGFDRSNNIGPAAAEIVRLWPDGSWEIVVGNARDGKHPISGLNAGFNNFFCGYVWKMGVHDGWLYTGTMDWTVILYYTRMHERPLRTAKLIAEAGVEDLIGIQGGFDLWRTYDGENWVPVTRTGFGNPYNFGCRNILSTRHGLFIGSANPFGPRSAMRTTGDWTWEYRDNPAGGLEVWHAGGEDSGQSHEGPQHNATHP